MKILTYSVILLGFYVDRISIGSCLKRIGQLSKPSPGTYVTTLILSAFLLRVVIPWGHY